MEPQDAPDVSQVSVQDAAWTLVCLAAQASPSPQDPQAPPQPSGPQVFPSHAGTQPVGGAATSLPTSVIGTSTSLLASGLASPPPLDSQPPRSMRLVIRDKTKIKRACRMGGLQQKPLVRTRPYRSPPHGTSEVFDGVVEPVNTRPVCLALPGLKQAPEAQ